MSLVRNKLVRAFGSGLVAYFALSPTCFAQNLAISPTRESAGSGILSSEISKRSINDPELVQRLKKFPQNDMATRTESLPKNFVGREKGAGQLGAFLKGPSTQQTTPEGVKEQTKETVTPLPNRLVCPAPDDKRCNKSAGILRSSDAPEITISRKECEREFQGQLSGMAGTSESSRSAAYLEWLNGGSIFPIPNASKQETSYISTSTTEKLASFMRNCFRTGPTAAEKHFIGILVDSTKNELIGMGTLVDDSTVLTAAHVMFASEPGHTSFNLRDTKALRFYPADGPARGIRIVASDLEIPTDVQSFAAQNKDRARLKLAEKVSVGKSFPKLADVPAGPNTRFRIPGISLPWYQADVSLGKRPPDPNWQRWTDYLVIDPKSACSLVIDMDNGCILHGCSTFGGMSGAGVFLDEGSTDVATLTLVGVHSGTLLNPSACRTQATLPDLNVASRVVP